MNILFDEKKNLRALCAASAAYGVVFGILFLWRDLGINYFLFALFVLIGVYVTMSYGEGFDKISYLFCASCALVLSACFATSTNDFLNGLNFIIVPALFFTALMLSRKDARKTAGEWFTLVFAPLSRLGKLFSASSYVCFGESSGKKRNTLMALAGAAAAFIALLLIIPLMLSADGAFRELFLKAFTLKNIPETAVKIILCVFVAAYAFGVIHYLCYGRKLPRFVSPQASVPDAPHGAENAENINLNAGLYPYNANSKERFFTSGGASAAVISFLVCVLAVYAVFSGVQILYLFLKVSASLPADFDYASYARSGVFSLWALTVINLVITLVGIRLTKTPEGNANNALKAIFTSYTAVNVLMTASSFYKMIMYISAYGFTRFRVVVLLYLTVQLGLLIMLVFKIYRPKLRYAYVSFIVITLLYTALNCVNLDANVARLNIARYEKTGEIDLYYLTEELSYDAFDTVYAFISEEYGFELNGGANHEINYDFEKKEAFDRFRFAYERNKLFTESASWQEYNFMRARVSKIK